MMKFNLFESTAQALNQWNDSWNLHAKNRDYFLNHLLKKAVESKNVENNESTKNVIFKLKELETNVKTLTRSLDETRQQRDHAESALDQLKEQHQEDAKKYEERLALISNEKNQALASLKRLSEPYRAIPIDEVRKTIHTIKLESANAREKPLDYTEALDGLYRLVKRIQTLDRRVDKTMVWIIVLAVIHLLTGISILLLASVI